MEVFCKVQALLAGEGVPEYFVQSVFHPLRGEILLSIFRRRIWVMLMLIFYTQDFMLIKKEEQFLKG
jgi:hypothetical protein